MGIVGEKGGRGKNTGGLFFLCYVIKSVFVFVLLALFICCENYFIFLKFSFYKKKGKEKKNKI